MKYRILIFLILFKTVTAKGQGYREIYYPKVNDLEILVLDFWLEDGGKISDIKRVAETSTYEDSTLLNSLTTSLENQSFGEYKGEKIRAQIILKLINPKYKNKKLSTEECEKLDFLREGKFIYTDPMFKGIIVERHGKSQTEKSEKIELKGELEWLSNCEYNLLYPEASDGSFYKKTDIVHVEIIGVLENNTVIYKSIMNNEIYTGVMKKI